MDGGRLRHDFPRAYQSEYQYEAPGKLAGSIYADDADAEEFFVLGMLTPIPSGYLMCVIFVVEGLFFLLDLEDPYEGAAGSLGGVNIRNPWHHTQWLLLEILGLGDLAAAGVGAVGLWLATHPLPLTLGKLHRWDAVLSLSGVGALVVWRILVVLAVVPWVGFMLAFDPPEFFLWTRFVGALLFLCFNLFLLYLLLVVFRAASEANQRLQDERQELLQREEAVAGAGASTNAVVLFKCLPLEATVGLYALTVLVASMLCLSKVIIQETSGGGWAFFSRFAQNPSETYWLEISAYLISIGFSFLGGAAVVVHRGIYGQDDEAGKDLVQKCKKCVLGFLLASMLRFALFVPITGMALAAGDICGIYIRLLASLSLERKLAQGAGLHCSVADWVTLGAMIVVLLLDAYLVRGVLLLANSYGAKGEARRKRDGTNSDRAIGRAACNSGADPTLAYGSAADAW